MIQEDMQVLEHQRIADGIYKLKLRGQLAEQIREPGQFVHVRVGGRSQSIAPLLRRPISISSADSAACTLTLIYRSGGLGTHLLSESAVGETVDVLGPLGHGFPVDAAPAGGNALLVGGGVGVPPLYGLSQALMSRGIQTTHILGFRSAKDVFYQQAFEAYGETYIMTEDGSCGKKGLVTDMLDRVSFDVAYAFLISSR